MSVAAATFKAAASLNEAVKSLYFCATAGQMEAVFSGYGIDSPEDKRELLHRCMGVEEYFDSSHEELSGEDEYEYAVSVFLEGSWRLLVDGRRGGWPGMT